MSFVNPAPLGGYVTGDLITEDQINYWCGILPDAIDGAGGGTYTLTAPLVLNGDNVTIDENLSVHGDQTITGQLVVSGAVSFFDDMTFGNSSLDQATFNCIVVCQRDLSVDGNTVLGNASGDTITVTGTMTLATPLGFTGSGRVLETGIVSAPDSSPTINVLQNRNVFLGTATGTHTVTLTASGAVDGDWCILANYSGFSQNLAGLVGGAIANNEVIKLMRLGGWAVFFRVT